MASKLDQDAKAKLREDLRDVRAIVDADRPHLIVFEVAGYERPPYHGQHPYPVEARVDDLDGAELTLVLYADECNRLLELELIRWDEKDVSGPRWESLKVW